MKKLIIPVVVLVLAAGAALWWFVLRSDEPAELSTQLVPTTADAGSGAEPTGEVPESLDGSWSVQPGGETQAGFRISETFVSGLADHVAVGRSPEVSGSIVVEGTQIAEGSFTVDLTALEFTDDPGISVANRANAMRGRGLETDRFPEATFVLTAPIDFGEVPAEGETVTAEATGDLTLHGVTNEVTFTVEAVLAGNTIRVVAAEPVPVVLADYEIEAPSAPMVASIEDEGSFEFLLVFTQD